jgi:purine nucleosidase
MYYEKYLKYKSKYINLSNNKKLIGGAIPKNPNAKLVIIDTDPGIDDSMALLLALGSPQLKVIAITTVFGNHPDVKIMTDNAMKILDLANCSHIPVYEGCGMPITGYANNEEYVFKNKIGATQSMRIHGETGIGEGKLLALLPSSRSGPSEGHAVNKIIELVRSYQNQITLITLGPLTNLARALEMAPDIGPLFKEVIVMGGALFAPRGHPINTPDANLGNAKPSVEANFMKDPEAADIVFSKASTNPLNKSIIPCEKLILIPLDTTTQTDYLTSGLIDFFKSPKNITTLIGSFLLYNHEFYVDAYINIFKRKIVPLHDSCAVFYAINPHNFRKPHHIDVRIDLGTLATRGRTIIDNRTGFNIPGVDKWTSRATYYEIINAEALYDSIRNSITTLIQHAKLQ